MTYLCLDVTTAKAFVALVDCGANTSTVITHDTPLQASSWLIPTFHDLLSQCGIATSDLRAIICATGPGSFTGIRIGLAAAQGYGYGLDIPIIGIKTFDFYKRGFVTPSMGIAIDSKRGDYYSQWYEGGVSGEAPVMREADDPAFQATSWYGDSGLLCSLYEGFDPCILVKSLQPWNPQQYLPSPYYMREPSTTVPAKS